MGGREESGACMREAAHPKVAPNDPLRFCMERERERNPQVAHRHRSNLLTSSCEAFVATTGGGLSGCAERVRQRIVRLGYGWEKSRRLRSRRHAAAPSAEKGRKRGARIQYRARAAVGNRGGG